MSADASPEVMVESAAETAEPQRLTTTDEHHALEGNHHPGTRRDRLKLALGALGVVYGDIGTSPLYALKECMVQPDGVTATHNHILGVLSLFVWSLMIVVTIKYLVFVLRADNNGEGGVLALMALVNPRSKRHSLQRTRRLLVIMGLFGAALLYGDGMITPAISVLSAVEGIEVATSSLSHVIVPITCVILIALFLVQRRGTEGIGKVFGPTMLIWFTAIAAAGIPAIIKHPDVLAAVNPYWGYMFFVEHGFKGFLVLGSVVLCVTGGEALYADMGHFGRGPIRVAWSYVVFPALLINYFGQGANLLADPSAAKNPFYALVEGRWLYPMVCIATVATVVASQALISGAYSLTRQAIQLGYSPRMTIVHTSGKTEGQIYIPEVNGILMFACVGLVLVFKSSSALADAYGVAVTGTMTITSILFYFAMREVWGWSRLKSLSLLSAFLFFDLAFLLANAAKIFEGGWVPLAIAGFGLLLMTTWKRGRHLLSTRTSDQSQPLDDFIAEIESNKVVRVPGTAVFMTSVRRGTPRVLLHHVKHNKVLHEKVVVLTITTDDVPEVHPRNRIRFREFGHGFFGVTAHYGFMESPHVKDILRMCRKVGLKVNANEVSFYLGRETLVAAGSGRKMAVWRRQIFAFLSRNARSPTDFFDIPANRVVELGSQVEL